MTTNWHCNAKRKCWVSLPRNFKGPDGTLIYSERFSIKMLLQQWHHSSSITYPGNLTFRILLLCNPAPPPLALLFSLFLLHYMPVYQCSLTHLILIISFFFNFMPSVRDSVSICSPCMPDKSINTDNSNSNFVWLKL